MFNKVKKRKEMGEEEEEEKEEIIYFPFFFLLSFFRNSHLPVYYCFGRKRLDENEFLNAMESNFNKENKVLFVSTVEYQYKMKDLNEMFNSKGYEHFYFPQVMDEIEKKEEVERNKYFCGRYYKNLSNMEEEVETIIYIGHSSDKTLLRILYECTTKQIHILNPPEGYTIDLANRGIRKQLMKRYI